MVDRRWARKKKPKPKSPPPIPREIRSNCMGKKRSLVGWISKEDWVTPFFKDVDSWLPDIRLFKREKWGKEFWMCKKKLRKVRITIEEV